MLHISWYESCVDTLIDRYICGGSALKESRAVSHGELFYYLATKQTQSPLVKKLAVQVTAFQAAVSHFIHNGFSKESIITAHQKLYSNNTSPTMTFRKTQNIVGIVTENKVIHVPPHFEQVPEQMEKWLSDITSSSTLTINEIIILYNQFLTIHPFEDGNGRMARAILKATMRNNGFTNPHLELYRFRFSAAKYSELFNLSSEADISSNRYWQQCLEWNKELSAYIESVFERCKQEIIQRTFLYTLSENEKKLLSLLYKYPVISQQKIVTECNISFSEAGKIIDCFFRLGLIVPQLDPYEENKVLYICKSLFHLMFEIDNFIFASINKTD